VLQSQVDYVRNQLSTEAVDKLGLTNLEGNSRSGLEVDWLFFAQDDSVTDSRHCTKRIVNMKGDKTGDAIVIRYGNAEVEQILYTVIYLSLHTLLNIFLYCSFR
jgi:hypothetical protein